MKKRILGGVLVAIIVIPLLLIGGLPFALLMAVLGAAGMYELLKVRKSKKEIPNYLKWFAYLAVMYLILNQYDSNVLVSNLEYSVLAALSFLFFIPILLVDDNERYNINDALFLFGSVLFIGLSFHSMIAIRNYSVMHAIYLFLITCITDIFALITGSLVGKTPLSKKFSPHKTIEGLLGGTIMATILASMFYLEAIPTELTVVNVVIITMTLSLIGQLGDLIFSSVKRYYKQKDFSNLIPGHGGILDRFDSIIFVALAASWFLFII